jgi:hypothetical protein
VIGVVGLGDRTREKGPGLYGHSSAKAVGKKGMLNESREVGLYGTKSVE